MVSFFIYEEPILSPPHPHWTIWPPSRQTAEGQYGHHLLLETYYHLTIQSRWRKRDGRPLSFHDPGSGRAARILAWHIYEALLTIYKHGKKKHSLYNNNKKNKNNNPFGIQEQSDYISVGVNVWLNRTGVFQRWEVKVWRPNETCGRCVCVLRCRCY